MPINKDNTKFAETLRRKLSEINGYGFFNVRNLKYN